MRKTSFSVKCWAIRWFSSRADSRSWPNGFSMIRRFQPVVERSSATFSTSGPIADGGTAK